MIARWFIFIALFCLIPAHAQSLKELQDAQRQERQEIERITNQLRTMEVSERTAKERLELLNSKIKSRGKLIGNLDSQIAILDNREQSVNSLVQTKADTVIMLHGAYNSLLYNLYAAQKRSGGVGHTSHRTAYFGGIVAQAITKQRQALSEQGVEYTIELQKIVLKKRTLDSLKSSHSTQLELMAAEEKEAQKMASKLQTSIKTLAQQQSERRAKLKQVEELIKKAIQSEVAQSATSGVSNAPLSKEFAGNKGKLPSPLGAGSRITDRYGLHTLGDGVKVDNKGINLTSTAVQNGSASVTAIFEGEVKRIFTVAGMGQCVIVRHGEYLSVYSNLDAINVKTSERVARGTAIGKITSRESLHFELWKENDTLNPSEWLFNIM